MLPIKYPSSDDWDAQVHLIVNSLPMSDEYMNIFQQATADDAVLRLLKMCNEHQKSQQKEPLLPHDTPVLPWEKIGADIFEYLGKNYFLLVDYYSKFFEINLIPTPKASDVIIHMKPQFAQHGIPREVISDNGPSFACEEFLKFYKSWVFKHITSSPRFPQSNGMAERAIQKVKHLLNKARKSGQDPWPSCNFEMLHALMDLHLHGCSSAAV
uniref:Integrase catalytic domain-containing protein n=1 Tax=Biomphalaria glabrata TaxID=6526 RepID=A0A2C9L8M1_BIOGL